MVPIKLNSTRATPLLMRILPALGIGYLAACFAAQSYLSAQKIDLVEWVDLKKAAEISKKLDKPIMYDFSAQWCGPCQALKQEVFGDKTLAKQINQMFVPVQVIDRVREDGANLLEVDNLQKKYKIDSFPTLVVMKVGQSDIRTQTGFKDKETTKEFIRGTLAWSMKGANPYDVDWKNLDDVIVSSHKSERPLLILFWDERKEYSRYEYLANKDLVKVIKENFVPVEVTVPIKANDFKLAESKDLVDKLAVKRSPALVIVPPDGGVPHFQIGNSTYDDNKDFLQKYLRFSRK